MARDDARTARIYDRRTVERNIKKGLLTRKDYADNWLSEAHDTHHPIASGLYYEDQRKEARQRAKHFRQSRIPKYLGYFEEVLERNGGRYLIGGRLTYPDLSMFQLVEGLRYAFPKAMKRIEKKVPLLVDLHDRVAQRPRVGAYLASKRRIPFNEDGIFRRYPALDG